jgi:N-hydroxyarylamine O-acetyltransferase
MNARQYLERINYTGPLDVSIDTLRRLHRAHMLAVPFENLDIHLGRPIVLDEEALFAKIVEHRRGGFCYELNGLFAALLREIGFEVTRISAGVGNASGGFAPDFDHMALVVQLDGPWLADVGFGDSFIEPIRLDESVLSEDSTGAYRIALDGDIHRIMFKRLEDGSWRPEFRFTLNARELSDYDEMCAYHQTSPESPFTQRRVCSLATETGRLTLTDLKLIKTDRGEREERILSDENEAHKILAQYFGIVI